MVFDVECIHQLHSGHPSSDLRAIHMGILFLCGMLIMTTTLLLVTFLPLVVGQVLMLSSIVVMSLNAALELIRIILQVSNLDDKNDSNE